MVVIGGRTARRFSRSDPSAPIRATERLPSGGLSCFRAAILLRPLSGYGTLLNHLGGDSEMPTLQEVKLKKLHEFRTGLLGLNKADLRPKLISSYWESNRNKLIPSGIVDNLGRRIQTFGGIDDVDALDGARDELVKMLDDTIASLSGADVRPILDDLILKIKDVKLSTLLREFNAIKNQQPNSAAIVLRTIICLIIREKAKLSQPGGTLATRNDLMLSPMLQSAFDAKIFDEGATKLLRAFQQQGLKETFDNVVHKPGDNALIKADDISSLVQNTVNKLLAALV